MSAEIIEAKPQDRSGEAHRLLDRAWGVAIGAAIYAGIGIGPIALFTFGVFVGPIIADTGWSKEAVAATIGPATLLLAIGQPIAGLLGDRFGVRAVSWIAAPILALCLAAVGLLAQTPGQFALLFAITFFLGALTAPPIFVRAVSHWFDRRRGAALAIMFAGGSIGIAALSPIAAALIARFGWRMAYVGLGLIALIVMWVVTAILLKEPPQTASAVRGQGSGEGLGSAEALRTRRFWIMVVGFILLTAGISGGVVNFPVILSGRGVPAQQAAFIMTVIGIANLFGRIAMGLVLDRMFSPLATIIVSMCPLLGFLMLGFTSDNVAMIAAAALLGFGLGAESDALAYIASRAFGTRKIGAIFGMLFMSYGVGAALGPAAFGVALQKGNLGTLPYFACAALIAVSMLCLALLKRHDLPYSPKSP